jgi:uncharacterized protein YdaU (DUF1376 family)
MAVISYIRLYGADCLADTVHLAMEEYGAYLLSIFNYWQTDRPGKKSRMESISGFSSDRSTDVQRPLQRMFNGRSVVTSNGIEPDRYRNTL